jgi:uncharacterized lipoprotein YbaY
MLKTTPLSRLLLGFAASSLAAFTGVAFPAQAEEKTSLPDVAARGNIAEVRRLLDNGTPVDGRQSGTGWTPLITAIRAGHTEVASLLLDRGANPNTAGVTGYTPLMAATQARNARAIQLLLLRGANPNKGTPKGLTPLMLAASNKGDSQAQAKNLECVKMLLRGGADPDRKHASGATALALAVERGNPAVAEYLRRVGAGGVPSAPRGAANVSDGTITGNVLYRERIAVPPGAFALVRLLDTAPKIPVVLAQKVTPFAGKQVPLPFSLPYKAATLAGRPGARFALDARIVSGGAARFRTQTPVPVLSPGSTNKGVTLPLVRVTDDLQARLAAEAIAATDQAITQTGTGFSGTGTLGELATRYTASFLSGRLVRIVATSSQAEYGTRTDRFYFDDATDAEGFPVLRASYLSANRVARTPAPGGSGASVAAPGQYEQVVQKILLGDAGNPLLATRTVNKQEQSVSDADITAARNFSRLIASEALRAANKKR